MRAYGMRWLASGCVEQPSVAEVPEPAVVAGF
jgi:hypothetical protein